MSGGALLPQHRADFERSGLSAATIEASGAYSVTQLEAKQLLGFDPGSGGWVLPYPHREGLSDEFDFKPDVPFVGSDGKSRKYLRRINSTNRIYIPPIIPMERLQSKRETLCIFEGAKKALKAAQEGIVSIAISGVWNWKFRDDMNDSRTITDLTDVWLKGRDVIICFDSDVVTKPGVAAAEFQFAKKLRELGAKVEGIRLPAGPNGEKVGGDDYLMSHTKEDFWQVPRDPLTTAPGKSDNRPEIIITGQFMRDVTDKSIQAIQQDNTPNPYIFQYGSSIARLNGATIETLSLPSLKGVLDRAANYYKLDDKGMRKPTAPPQNSVQDILSLRVHDLSFPILTGISTVPTFLTGGRLLSKNGYDEGSGIFLSVNGLDDLRCDMPLQDAVKLITNDMFGDFPFADDASRAHAICALLLPFVRHMIDGPTLLHLIEASLRGTGKGLLADLVSWVCIGAASEPIALPKSEEEIEKRIMSILMSGALIVLLDNIYKIKSSTLCVALTTEKFQGRILGKSEMRTIPNKALWIATGNNVELSDEQTRRTISIRLDSNIARPEERCNFKHPNLIQWVQQNRSRIVSACLSIVQHWINAGMPHGTATLGRFESWAGVMGGILDVAGIPGFLKDRDRLHSQNDQESTEWAAVVDVWYQQYGQNAVTAKDVFTILKEHELLLDIWAGRSALAGQQRLGHSLYTKRDRVYKTTSVSGVSGVKINSAGQDSRTGNSAYRLIPIYINFHSSAYNKTPETPETPVVNSHTRINTGHEGSAVGGCLYNKTPETPAKTPAKGNDTGFDFEMEVEL